MTEQQPPVVVIGAGPVGLAAAAHLAGRGLTPLVLEPERMAGAAVREWAHVRLFSPWSELVDAEAEKLLAPPGWTRPDPAACPTGGEWAERYLQPLADVPNRPAAAAVRLRRPRVRSPGDDPSRARRGDAGNAGREAAHAAAPGHPRDRRGRPRACSPASPASPPNDDGRLPEETATVLCGSALRDAAVRLRVVR